MKVRKDILHITNSRGELQLVLDPTQVESVARSSYGRQAVSADVVIAFRSGEKITVVDMDDAKMRRLVESIWPLKDEK